MKSRKSHYRQVHHHAYSTYIQVSSQANINQKLIKKEQKSSKPRKTIQKIEKILQKYVQKGYMTLPSPYLKLTISSLRADEL